MRNSPNHLKEMENLEKREHLFTAYFCVLDPKLCSRQELKAASNHKLSKGSRIDAFLADCYPQFSRAQIQQWIADEKILVDNNPCKRSSQIQGKEEIKINASLPAAVQDKPQHIELDIVYEDEDLILINKPAGMVVHPGAGNPSGTLLNGLLAYNKELRLLPRAGIVHRLDRGTSGLMIAAKNTQSYNYMQRLIKMRKVKREYLALVEGVLTSGCTVDVPIGRNPHNRLAMKAFPTLDKNKEDNGDYRKEVISKRLRRAVTHFRVIEKFTSHCLIRASLETGRTHQIRVHLLHLGYPIVGDTLYGWKKKVPPANPDMEEDVRENLLSTIRNFADPALHACSLSFIKENKQAISLSVPPPPALENIISILRQTTP